MVKAKYIMTLKAKKCGIADVIPCKYTIVAYLYKNTTLKYFFTLESLDFFAKLAIT